MKSLSFGRLALPARALAQPHAPWCRFIGTAMLVAALAAGGATQTWASAQIASTARSIHNDSRPVSAADRALAVLQAPAAAPVPRPSLGADVDGDGRGDFINPTGGTARSHDAYGSGAFGASRDGGERAHEGVDYVSQPGQVVVAPMSGYVARVGYAYGDDAILRTVEIVNPALNYVAKVLYVSPSVEVGQAVSVGAPIGRAQNLLRKYPNGMTNHVHLQVARKGRAWMNAERLISSARG